MGEKKECQHISIRLYFVCHNQVQWLILWVCSHRGLSLSLSIYIYLLTKMYHAVFQCLLILDLLIISGKYHKNHGSRCGNNVYCRFNSPSWFGSPLFKRIHFLACHRLQKFNVLFCESHATFKRFIDPANYYSVPILSFCQCKYNTASKWKLLNFVYKITYFM